jgi:hypothetical protein
MTLRKLALAGIFCIAMTQPSFAQMHKSFQWIRGADIRPSIGKFPDINRSYVLPKRRYVLYY